MILEGVLQYLNPESAASTLETIEKETGSGSWFVFDYAHASALRGDGNDYGESGMIKGVKDFGESWQFGLEKSEVESFLVKYGFSLLDHKSPKDLEELYFKDSRGEIKARINGTQSIVMAVRKDER